MNREKIYFLKDGEPSTFVHDENLPALPLPKLEHTLERYYETLKPFGNQEELENSRKTIKNFQNGIGRELHNELEKKASKEKNWVEKWWEDYAYGLIRFPLYPYCVMAMPLMLEKIGIPETRDNYLKTTARIMYHTLEFEELIRLEKLKPGSANGGKSKFSSYLYKRFISTTRVPGEEMDKIVSHFKTASEGGFIKHGLISGKGRIFIFDCFNNDGTILTPQQFLVLLQIVQSTLDYEDEGDCVPVLTSDDRTSWSRNRKHLQELSPHNKDLLHLIESAVLVASLDDHEPKNYSESSQYAIAGDFHSKWGDRSSVFVIFRNGKISCVGEHAAYDGTISISFGVFIMLSLYECSEPDWSLKPESVSVPIEMKFHLDDHLRSEIKRVLQDCESRKFEVIVCHDEFNEYGKGFMKEHKLHPDAYVQMIIQLTYVKMHNEIAPTYETALMREYYNGRTETLRACTTECSEFVRLATNPQCPKAEVLQAFKKAINKHNEMMSNARKGDGVDRHLFGLWCVAYEKNIDIPEFFSDPLYTKSGGGGNFVLSTSSLGYTMNTGFVAPMTTDGYGVFYSITDDEVYIIASSYRSSSKTSAHKYVKCFEETLREMKKLIEAEASPSKL